MARPVNVASGATGVQVYTGAGCLMGVTVTNGAAAQTINFYDNTSAAGTILATLYCPANETAQLDVPAVQFVNGIYANRSQTSTLLVYLF